MNVAPKGINIGYKGKPKPVERDKMSVAHEQYVNVASKMEDSTELTIKNIERLRRDTLTKAEIGPKRKAQ